MIRNCMITLAMIIFSSALFAKNQDPIFTITYAKNSPLQTIPLANAHVKLLIYYYGIPEGYISVSTDENQQFTYNGYKNAGINLAFELVKIEDENKYKAHCHGTTTISKPHVLLIHCKRP